MNRVIDEIQAERQRQQTIEGWTPEHDDKHKNGELAQMAACYAQSTIPKYSGPYTVFPFDEGDKRCEHPARKILIIAAALIVAEIERLDRLKGDKT